MDKNIAQSIKKMIRCVKCGKWESVHKTSYCGWHNLCLKCAEESFQQDEFVN